MTNKNSSKMEVPQAKEAMNRFKMEVANEIGVNLKDGYNGDLTSREAGSIRRRNGTSFYNQPFFGTFKSFVFLTYTKFTPNTPFYIAIYCSISFATSSGFLWVYTSNVVDISECPITNCNVFTFIPFLTMRLQNVCLNT